MDHLSPSMTVLRRGILYSCMASLSFLLMGFLAHQTHGTSIGSQNRCIIFLRPLLDIITIFTPAALHSSIQSCNSSAGSFSEWSRSVLSRSHKSSLTFSCLSKSGVTSSKRSNFLFARINVMVLFYHILHALCLLFVIKEYEYDIIYVCTRSLQNLLKINKRYA